MNDYNVTPAQSYKAMMLAADFIERNPKQYNFDSVEIPESEYGCNACMVGWFGYFLQQCSDFKVDVVCGYKLNCIRNAACSAGFDSLDLYDINNASSCTPKSAANKMRMFAEKHWGSYKNISDEPKPVKSLTKYDWKNLMESLAKGPSLQNTKEIV